MGSSATARTRFGSSCSTTSGWCRTESARIRSRGDVPEGHHALRSTYQEEVELDSRGRLVKHALPMAGSSMWLLEPAPELPAWRNEPLYSNIRRKQYRPPEGATFTYEDIDFEGPAVTIGAAATTPEGDGPHPAVLFLGGAGRHDRNGIVGEIGGVYAGIVDHLSEHGFFGLRYDKRGAGTTKVGPDPLMQLGLTTVLEDARAALAYLTSRPEVDADRIYLLGHSQGGKIALTLASEGAPIAGIGLLAAGGLPMDQVILNQARAMAEQKGLDGEQIEARLAETERWLEHVRSGVEFKEGEVEDIFVAQARSVPFIRDHLRYDLQELIKRTTSPVAIFHGAKDFQVKPEEAEILAAAAVGAGVDAELFVIPELDHGFMRVVGESTLASYWDDRPVDAGFLDTLTSWLRSHAFPST